MELSLPVRLLLSASLFAGVLLLGYSWGGLVVVGIILVTFPVWWLFFEWWSNRSAGEPQ